MGTYRVQMGFPMDTALPRDVITLNPHFHADDPNALAVALSDNLKAWIPIGTKPFTIKVYDALKAPPSYPLAVASQAGTPPASAAPREVALCLSYYTGYNRPRYRGRLFLPSSWITSVVNVRPTTTHQNGAVEFATSVLTKTLPSGASWQVFSTVEKKEMGRVDHCWVDDEWDTIRSRGLDPTQRVTATLP